MNKLKHSIVSSSIKKSLSILLNSDGFSFCINDFDTKKPISFGKYYFEEGVKAPEFILGEVLRIFANDKELQQDFIEINVIHQNNLSSLVPVDYFDDTKLKQYLDFNVKTFSNDYIVYDQLMHVNAKNVYIPYVNINNYLLQNFGEFEFKHHSTVLIDKLIEYSKHSLIKDFFVYVSEKSIDIIIIDAGKLVFYNSFLYDSPQDFVYYILFVAEQLDIDPMMFPVIFLGEIREGDANYALTYKYVYKIKFITSISGFFKDSEIFNNHSNYLLVN